MRVSSMVFLFALVACGGASEPAPAPAATGGFDAALLQKADLADGVEDKVVSKCPACALGMDGDPAHAVEVDGYTLHFCSESCAMGMASKPEGIAETVRRAVGGS